MNTSMGGKKIKHQYAELLHAIADGHKIQILGAAEWRDIYTAAVLHSISRPDFDVTRYRVKPDTVTVNGVECAAPNPALRGAYKVRIVELDGASAKRELWLYFGNCSDSGAVYEALKKPFQEI